MRDRTADLLRARQALSQLSYSPNMVCIEIELVGLGRFELPTSPLSGVRSNQLSYRPNSILSKSIIYTSLYHSNQTICVSTEQ